MGCEVSQIIAAGTAAHTIIVKMISQTAVIFSAMTRLSQVHYLKFVLLQHYLVCLILAKNLDLLTKWKRTLLTQYLSPIWTASKHYIVPTLTHF